LWPLETVADSRLGVVFREAYSTGILQVWYLSIDVYFILFHMEFEDGLSILVFENRAAYHKK
jgi:hypothetical protein